jgi:hypothetical protein
MSLEKAMAELRRGLHTAAVNALLNHFRVNVRGLVTLGQLEAALAGSGYADELTDILAAITDRDVRLQRTPTAALVVDAESGQPWPGFYDRLRALGVELGDERVYWRTALAELGVARAAVPSMGRARRRRGKRSLGGAAAG